MEHRKKKKSKTQQKSKLSKAQKRRSNESLQPVGSGSGEKQSPRTRKARKQRSVTSLEKSDSAENLNKSSHQKVRRKLTPEPNGRGRPARERSIFDIIRLKRNSQAEDKNLSRSSESTAKTMKSRRPTPRSMMKLTSRVKRRDEQVMKKRGSLSGEREDGRKKDSREGLPKNIPKKSEDNYREVFPQVKLWFDSETPRNPRHSREELESEPSLQIAMISSREPEQYSTTPDTTKTARAYTSDICTAQSIGPSLEDDQLANTQPMSGSLLICATPESPPKASSKETPLLPITGMPCVRNKDNDGNVIVDGRPFWYQQLEEDLTDEGNVLNAAVILEVASGNLSLVNMPDEPIELDVYGEWKELRSRDATCFNKDVLFGNTIRSMVNLFEESVKSRGRKKHDKEQRSGVVSFILPEMVVFYMRDDLDYLTEIEFTPSERKRKRRPPTPSC